MNEIDQEIRDGTNGWDIPVQAATDELEEVFTDKHVTFRKHDRGFDVYLDGNENVNVVSAAAMRGYETDSINVIEGPFSVKITLCRKIEVWSVNDSKEHQHRLVEGE